ncbi:hypothetical protein [Desulforamulus ferrireducens]|uniref:Uncharacterized protein n=1 Tax=Desulforamulus ferrireducens TaxID=1833852 RepID=A0A1S6ITM5_9FIRM|nr:hypothetical protein [Desulforamulus ferrireducens]AQS58118.1 hypothetical protein B0537_02825 [Desulforamulus ferrireducens]
MESALFISNARHLNLIENPQALKSWPSQVTAPPDMTFTRIYFGQEFCERAIPQIADVLQAMDLAHQQRKKFTLVTPYVTESGLKKLTNIFEQLQQIYPNCEVVVNDWGVLHLLRRQFPRLTPILGRLLNKMWRDPRIEFFLKEFSPEELQLFRTCGLASPYMQDLMKRLAVKRIEVDNLPQGLDPSLASWGFQVSLYLPFGCISTGRICFSGSWGLKPKEKFKANAQKCGQQCQSHWLEILEPACTKAKIKRILQKGNTLFYLQTNKFMEDVLSRSGDLGISRIIYQPTPL